MRNLLEDDEEPDSREHALDHRVWHIVCDHPQTHDAERELEEAGQNDGEEEALIGSDLLDCREADNGEAGCRSANAHLGTGEQADNHTTHNPRDDAAE